LSWHSKIDKEGIHRRIDTQTHIEENGDPISLNLFFKNKGSRLKKAERLSPSDANE
jgi:hypothetical protein